MPEGKIMARKRQLTTRNVGAHCDHDFEDHELVNKKTGKRITNVISFNIKVGCAKVWSRDKDGNRITKFREGLELEWRPKTKTKKKTTRLQKSSI